MNKIINGKRYNTESAKLLGSFDNGEYPSDLSYVRESLYRTKSGQYFIHGEGGASTQYAQQREISGWRPGEKIIPLAEDCARNWAEEHLSGEVYERIFGETQEAEPETKLVRISAETSALLEQLKERTGETYMNIVGRLVRDFADSMNIK